jgi:hypothetical protein
MLKFLCFCHHISDKEYHHSQKSTKILSLFYARKVFPHTLQNQRLSNLMLSANSYGGQVNPPPREINLFKITKFQGSGAQLKRK